MKRDERQIGKRHWLLLGRAMWTGRPGETAGRRDSLRLGIVLLLLGASLVACGQPQAAPARTATEVATTAVVVSGAPPTSSATARPSATATKAAPTSTSTPAPSATAMPQSIATAVPPAATRTPSPAPTVQAPTVQPTVDKPPTAVTWDIHSDDEKSFKYPAGWTSKSIESGIQYSLPSSAAPIEASIYARQAYRLGTAFSPSSGFEDKSETAVSYLELFLDKWLRQQTFTVFDPRRTETVNGNAATIQPYMQMHGARDVAQLGNTRGLAVVIQKGDYAYYVSMITRDQWWSTYEPLFLEMLKSFVAKKG